MNTPLMNLIQAVESDNKYTEIKYLYPEIDKGDNELTQISMKVEKRVVETSKHSVKIKLSIEQIMQLKDLHGVDMIDMSIDAIKNEMQYGIDKKIVEAMKLNRYNTNIPNWKKKLYEWLKIPVNLIDDNQSFRSIMSIIMQMFSLLYRQRLSLHQRWIMVNPILGSIFEDCAGFQYSTYQQPPFQAPINSPINSPVLIGNVSGMKVYTNLNLNNNEIIVGTEMKDNESGIYLVKQKSEMEIQQTEDTMSPEISGIYSFAVETLGETNCLYANVMFLSDLRWYQGKVVQIVKFFEKISQKKSSIRNKTQ